ncbi:hypothetical protein Tco_0792509 [Tanacetum coccineum]
MCYDLRPTKHSPFRVLSNTESQYGKSVLKAVLVIIGNGGKVYDPTCGPLRDRFVSIGIKASSTFRGSNTRSGGLWSGGLDLKKKGANRDQRARSGDLWSGGLDPDRGANRD